MRTSTTTRFLFRKFSPTNQYLSLFWINCRFKMYGVKKLDIMGFAVADFQRQNLVAVVKSKVPYLRIYFMKRKMLEKVVNFQISFFIK